MKNISSPLSNFALVAADFAQVDVDIQVLDDKKVEDYKEFIPTGKFPSLRTQEGVLFESNTISRYFARVGTNKGLYGNNDIEASLIDQWLDYSATALTTISKAVIPIFASTETDPKDFTNATKEAKDVAMFLEKQIKGKEFFVGN